MRSSQRSCAMSLLQQPQRFGLKKGLDNLDAVRQTFKVITSRFAGFQAQWSTFTSTSRFCSALRCRSPSVRSAIRYQNPRQTSHSLLEVLLHGGTHVGGWTAREITNLSAPPSVLRPSYGLNQLRYDLRKLKGHGLLERDGSATLTASPQRVFKSRCYFCSSTTAVRTTCQQPLPPPSGPSISPRQPTRSRLPPRRQGHPEYRRFARHA